MEIYKVYLRNNDFSVEQIRKFTLIPGCGFNKCREKIVKMFPELTNKEFTISWRDDDEEILMSSQEEFEIAEKQMIAKQLYVRLCLPKSEIPNSKKENVVHRGIVCDGCDGNVIGYRYKCIQCDDYDLCSQCETTGKHSHHYMIRMPEPLHQHYCQNLFHNFRKILKKYGIYVNKHGVYLNKKNTLVENTFQGIECSISPWLNNFIDTLLQVHAIDPDSSKIHKTERKEKSKDNIHVDDNTSKKFPGEGKKLNDKESMSDVASTESLDSSTTKVEADEWTVIDKNYAEINQASSRSSSISEINAKQIPSSSMAPSEIPTAPKETSSTQTIYPKLPKTEKIKYHQNPIINEAVEAMIKMGFSNQDGLLTYLLGAEDGDINKVLEILQPTNK